MGIIFSSPDTSPNLTNNQNIQLVFKNIYKTKDRKKLQKLKKLAVSSTTKKYIEKNANLWYKDKNSFPSDFDSNLSKVKLTIKNIKIIKNRIQCSGLLKIKKNKDNLTQQKYANFLSDPYNGPFEQPWDTSPTINKKNNVTENMIHLQTPIITY